MILDGCSPKIWCLMVVLQREWSLNALFVVKFWAGADRQAEFRIFKWRKPSLGLVIIYIFFQCWARSVGSSYRWFVYVKVHSYMCRHSCKKQRLIQKNFALKNYPNVYRKCTVIILSHIPTVVRVTPTSDHIKRLTEEPN